MPMLYVDKNASKLSGIFRECGSFCNARTPKTVKLFPAASLPAGLRGYADYGAAAFACRRLRWRAEPESSPRASEGWWT